MQIYLPIAEMSVNILLLLGMGAGVGFLSGMFGVGGGFLMTPLLIFTGIPPAVAVATEANQIVASSVSGALAHYRRRSLDLKMGGVLLLGGSVGSFVGVAIFSKLKEIGQVDLMISLAYVLFLGVIGALMLVESLQSINKAKKGGKIGRRRQALTPGYTGCPSKCDFAAPGSTSAPYQLSSSVSSSACWRPSWALAAASLWFRP